MRKINDEEAKKILNQESKKITEDELRKILEKQRQIEDKFTSSGPLGKYVEDAKLLISIIKDYFNGSYKDIPWHSITAIAAALLYVLNPLDVIPDFIPVIGLLDDATVVAICLKLIEQDLQKYKDWKLKHIGDSF